VAELEALALAGEDHLMVAGDAAAAQDREADAPRLALAALHAVEAADGGEGGAAALRRRGAEEERRPGGRVALHPVVHLDDLYVPVRAEAGRRFLHEVAEQVDAERGVGRVDHGDLGGRRVEQSAMVVAEPGRADEDRLAGGEGASEVRLERFRRSEVDEDVAALRDDLDIVAVGGDACDGAAHPPARAEELDADLAAARHGCFMGKVTGRGKPAPEPRHMLSAKEARRIALAAQGLARPRPKGQVSERRFLALAERLNLFQIDSVNVLARAHYLPAFSRLGAYDPALLDRAAWGRPRRLFEYWAHEASLLPFDLHPLLRWRMAAADRGEIGWGSLRAYSGERRGEAEAVLARIAGEGPLAASDFEKGGGGWWEWSDAKRALEWLFWAGKITTATRRSSFERVYDLPERVLPAAMLAMPTPAPEEARRALLLCAGRALGVATARDLRDYFRLSPADAAASLEALAEAGALIPVRVEGWRDMAWLYPEAGAPRRVSGRALLAPFDPLIWERSRAERLFGLRYRIEIYTPAAKRVHGYYVLPFLLGDRIAARVDLKTDRKSGALLVQAAHAEPGAPAETPEALACELRLMAPWLGLTEVRVRRQGDLAEALAASVAVAS
jgi:uncharacterized protein YcaQ